MEKKDIFARKRIDKNYDLLYYNTGEPVTILSENDFPEEIWSENDHSKSCHYEHPEGIIIRATDVKKLGIKVEYNRVR